MLSILVFIVGIVCGIAIVTTGIWVFPVMLLSLVVFKILELLVKLKLMREETALKISEFLILPGIM